MLAEAGETYQVEGQLETLGQVNNAYIVSRTPAGLVIVDQHAAHEAVLTENLLAATQSVSLSPAARLDLTAREAQLLEAHLNSLDDLGFEVEPFGGNSFLVRGLPAPLAEQDVHALATELLEEMAASRRLDPEGLREKLATRAACRAAVKAGDLLDADQQQALLDNLLAAWSPSTCPHGRPILFTITVEEMERRFLRR
jgi:DNA mismatch repair protein MutL